MEIAVTQFKAKCLELIRAVHDREQDSIVITRQGKPYAKLVPVDDPDSDFIGCMAGLVEIRGDLTEPTGARWEALEDPETLP